MKILSLVTTDLNYDQRMQRICHTLSETGYEVTLIGRKKRASEELRSRIFAQRRLSCWFETGKLFYLEYNLRLLWLLLFARFDLCCAVDLDTLLPATLICKLRGKALIYDAHEYFTETPEVARRPRIQRVWERVARFCIPRTTDRYTVAPKLAERMGRHYGVPFGVVRNLSRSTDYPCSEVHNFDAKILLYQGALNEGRGLEALLEALPRLPGVTLWLAGEGDLSEQLRATVRDRGLGDRVVFHGYVRPRELTELTRRATVGLNLLEDRGLSYRYSLANKAIDYLHAGLPSVHMDFPEYRYLHERYGSYRLLPDLQPATIAAAIADLLRDRHRYEAERRAALLAARQLNWEAERTVLVGIYQKICPIKDSRTTIYERKTSSSDP